jgi:hypothetical protein
MPPTLGDRNLNTFAEPNAPQNGAGKGGLGESMTKSASDPSLTQSQTLRKQNQARDSMAVLPSATEGVFAAPSDAAAGVSRGGRPVRVLATPLHPGIQQGCSDVTQRRSYELARVG